MNECGHGYQSRQGPDLDLFSNRVIIGCTFLTFIVFLSFPATLYSLLDFDQFAYSMPVVTLQLNGGIYDIHHGGSCLLCNDNHQGGAKRPRARSRLFLLRTWRQLLRTTLLKMLPTTPRASQAKPSQANQARPSQASLAKPIQNRSWWIPYSSPDHEAK